MICVDSLGEDFPTFPQFVQMLREYERQIPAPSAAPRGQLDRNTLDLTAKSMHEPVAAIAYRAARSDEYFETDGLRWRLWRE